MTSQIIATKFDLIWFGRLKQRPKNLKKIWNTNHDPRNLIWFDLIYFCCSKKFEKKFEIKNIIPQIWFDLICFIFVEANNLKKIWITNHNPRNLIWFDFFGQNKIWFDKGNSTLRFFEYLKGIKDFLVRLKRREVISQEKPFSGRSHFLGKSHSGEKPFTVVENITY